jgi:hypothetical protein
MDPKEIRKRIREAKRLAKEASDYYDSSKYANPNLDPDMDGWNQRTDAAAKAVTDLYDALPHEEDVELAGYWLHRLVGDYVVYVQAAGRGWSRAGNHMGDRFFIAIHIKTGRIRRRDFAFTRDPYGWWMDLLKTDDGTDTDEEWKQKSREYAQQLMFKRLGIE